MCFSAIAYIYIYVCVCVSTSIFPRFTYFQNLSLLLCSYFSLHNIHFMHLMKMVGLLFNELIPIKSMTIITEKQNHGLKRSEKKEKKEWKEKSKSKVEKLKLFHGVKRSEKKLAKQSDNQLQLLISWDNNFMLDLELNDFPIKLKKKM